MKPASRVLPILLATALLARGENEDVFQRLRRALAASGDGERAVAALAQKDFAVVEAILAKSTAVSDPGRAELLALRGAVEFLDGKMRPAANAFREAAALAPLKDGDRFTLAMSLVTLGDDDQARTILTGLTAKYPERPIYLYWLGRIDYDQRRYREAAEKLGRVTELDPQSARAWNSLGLTFDMEGQQEKAREALEKAVNLNRGQAHPSPMMPHDLGSLLLRMDQAKEAESALRESLRYDPGLAQSHYHLARALEKEGRDKEAVAEYLSATSLDTKSADACYSLAVLYKKLGRESDAAAMFAEWRKRKM